MSGEVLAGGSPGGEVGQLHAEQGGLQGVEAGVEADVLVVVLAGLAVVGELAQSSGAGGIMGEEGAAVAEGAEVFGWEERRSTYLSYCAGIEPIHRRRIDR